MKGSCALVASVLAASAVALSSSSGHHEVSFSSCSGQEYSHSSSRSSSPSAEKGELGKFAPRFDGLRFIETLVTAHR